MRPQQFSTGASFSFLRCADAVLPPPHFGVDPQFSRSISDASLSPQSVIFSDASQTPAGAAVGAAAASRVASASASASAFASASASAFASAFASPLKPFTSATATTSAFAFGFVVHSLHSM